VQFHGIDAPEKGQPDGREATEAVRTMLQGCQVQLGVTEQRDGFGRVVAIVYRGDTDVVSVLVNEGLALAYRRYLGFESYAVHCELEDKRVCKSVGFEHFLRGIA